LIFATWLWKSVFSLKRHSSQLLTIEISSKIFWKIDERWRKPPPAKKVVLPFPVALEEKNSFFMGAPDRQIVDD
jgi:hypothetical protein